MDRVKKSGIPNWGKGSNWFSITQEFAEYVVSKEAEIKGLFQYTCCADEIFLQTLLLNSKFIERCANDNLRLIDWKRGNPYTFREDDFEEIIRSEKLWARKFSQSISGELQERIKDYLKE